MRKAAALFLTAVILLLSVTQTYAFTIIYDGKVEDYPWAPIVLVVDGQTVETNEMPPIILNGRTMVPAREFFEELGCEVVWDNEAKRVIIEYNGERIILKINSKTVYIGSNSATIAPEDPAPKIINDKTMIPVRFVAEEFGFLVEWVNETRTVIITSPENEDTILTDVGFSTDYKMVDEVFVELDDLVNPNVFRMQNPDRIVVDIYGTKAEIEDGMIEAEGQAVKAVRYSQHEDRFRVVLDLCAPADYEVFKVRGGLEISVIKTGEYPDEDNLENEEPSTEIDFEDFEDTTIENDGQFIVILDPGHGGTDPGATYPTGVKDPQVKEKDLTLDIAEKIAVNLKAAGIGVIMTRDEDTYPTLKERVEMANSSEADLYVSVHINAMDNKDEIDGAQVYYHESSDFGKKLAGHVYNNIIDYTGFTKRGVQNGSSFYVLKYTQMPAILTESGFITNNKDRTYLQTEEGRQAIADAISDGILEALGIV